MNDDQVTYTLHLGGIEDLGDKVPVEGFAEILRNWIVAQRARQDDLSASLADGEWVVARVLPGSLQAQLEYLPGRHGSYVAVRAARDTAVALERIAATGSAGETVSTKVEASLIQLVAAAREARVPTVSLRDAAGRSMSSVVIAEAVESPLVRLAVQSYGSVEGQLVSISYVNEKSPTFSVRDWASGRVVACSLDTPDVRLAKVKDAIRQRVRVSGLVTRKVNGDVTVTETSRLFVFPSDDDLPFVRDLVGADRGIYGDGDVESWLKGLREDG